MGACKLERSLPCFGAAVAEEDAVESADLGEADREVGGFLVVEEVRGVQQPRALIVDSSLDCGMAIAERRHSNATQEIEVVVALGVGQIDVMAAHKQNRVALIGLKEQFTLRSLDRR